MHVHLMRVHLVRVCALGACCRSVPYTDESRDGDVYQVDEADMKGVWDVSGCGV